MKEISKKKRLMLVSLVAACYQAFFYLVESLNLNYTVIHSRLDDLIPFNEFFIIPYSIWFVFLALTSISVSLKATDEYFIKFLFLLFGSMTLCLIINIIFPSKVDLRPESYLRDNIFVDLVKFMHRIDTPTNVCPSIHACAQIICHMVLTKHFSLEGEKIKKAVLHLISTLVLMSTVILKQHSVIDLVLGVLLGFILFAVFDSFIFKESEIFKIKKLNEIKKEGQGA